MNPCILPVFIITKQSALRTLKPYTWKERFLIRVKSQLPRNSQALYMERTISKQTQVATSPFLSRHIYGKNDYQADSVATSSRSPAIYIYGRNDYQANSAAASLKLFNLVYGKNDHWANSTAASLESLTHIQGKNGYEEDSVAASLRSLALYMEETISKQAQSQLP
jgi:hypothetical protein